MKCRLLSESPGAPAEIDAILALPTDDGIIRAGFDGLNARLRAEGPKD